MLELLLLVPFAIAAGGGVQLAIGYVQMRNRGVEAPRALFSRQPPGEIRMHDWAQRQIEASMDAERARAIAIGRAELGLPDNERWAREYHRALEASGVKKRGLVPGELIIERTADGRVAIEHQLPDEYNFEGCDCPECRRSRQMWDDGEYEGWNPGPRTLKALDKLKKRQ